MFKKSNFINLMNYKFLLFVFLTFNFANVSFADPNFNKIHTVTLHKIDPENDNQYVGTIEISKSKYGLVFTPDLIDLENGIYGFQLRENNSCENLKQGEITIPAGQAGKIWDPRKAKKTGYPWDDAVSLGVLPNLYADQSNIIKEPVLAPRLKAIEALANLSLVLVKENSVIEGFSDNTNKFTIVACGLILDPKNPTLTN